MKNSKLAVLLFLLCASYASADVVYRCLDTKTKKTIFQSEPCSAAHTEKKVTIIDQGGYGNAPSPQQRQAARPNGNPPSAPSAESYVPVANPRQYQPAPEGEVISRQNSECHFLKMQVDNLRNSSGSSSKAYGDAVYRYNSKCR